MGLVAFKCVWGVSMVQASYYRVWIDGVYRRWGWGLPTVRYVRQVGIESMEGVACAKHDTDSNTTIRYTVSSAFLQAAGLWF